MKANCIEVYTHQQAVILGLFRQLVLLRSPRKLCLKAKLCLKTMMVKAAVIVAGSVLAACQPYEPVAVTDSDQVKVLTPDWGVAATLSEMGFAPVATGDLRVYQQWVGDSALPQSVTDLGIRFQPNAELVAQMDIDLVIDNFFYEHNRPMYKQTPIESIAFMADGDHADWEDYTKPTRKLGELIHQPRAAEHYLQQSLQQIAQSAFKFHLRHPWVDKVAVVQFSDSNNLRMYGHNSLFNAALKQMDLELVVLGESSRWGFIPIHLGDLAQLDKDTCLVVIEPMSPMLQAELKHNLVWQRLGYGQSRCMTKIPPTWMYGGPASLVTFAERLQHSTLSGGMASSQNTLDDQAAQTNDPIQSDKINQQSAL